MAAGKAFDDLWTQDDLATLLANKGCGDEKPYMTRAGFVEDVDYRRIFISGYDQRELKALLWRRRAMLSVFSLNIDGGLHHVYWDGSELFDPSTKKTYTYLSSLHITGVIIFAK